MSVLAEEHNTFTKEVNESRAKLGKIAFDKETQNEKVKKLEERAKAYSELMIEENRIFAKAANFKLTETFMEGAPQSVLQTYIFLVQDESISTSQYVTIISSFVILSYGAVGIYLSQPTKVIHLSSKTFVRSTCFCSKTSLTTGCVGGTWVNPPPCKMDTFFLRSLALSVPICRNFQSNGAKWRSLKLWLLQ